MTQDGGVACGDAAHSFKSGGLPLERLCVEGGQLRCSWPQVPPALSEGCAPIRPPGAS